MARGRAVAVVKEYGTLAIYTALMGAVLVVRAHNTDLTRFVDQRPLGGGSVYLLLNVFDAVLAPGVTCRSYRWPPVPGAPYRPLF